MENQGDNLKPNKHTAFPLTKESVDETLHRILGKTQSVVGATLRETIALQKNPSLFAVLEIISGSGYFRPYVYKEGAVWMHKFLREQAELRGEQLPLVSGDQVRSFFHDQQEEDEDKKGRYLRVKKTIETEEPELGRAFDELSKDLEEKDVVDFYNGGFDVYSLIRGAVSSQALEDKFGL